MCDTELDNFRITADHNDFISNLMFDKTEIDKQISLMKTQKSADKIDCMEQKEKTDREISEIFE